MKRLLSTLGLLFGLALLLHAAPASALPSASQCPATNINTTYPTDGHIYDCGKYDTTDFKQIYLALNRLETATVPFFQTSTNSGYGKGVPIYFVKDAATFTSLFPGYTLKAGDCATSPISAPFFVAVLGTCNGATKAQVGYEILLTEIDHELGHIWNDNHPYNGVLPDATTASLPAGTVNSFDALVQHDFLNLDAEDQAYTIGRPACGLNGGTGPFSGMVDPEHGNAQICSGNTLLAPYNKMRTNGVILQYILPYWFKTVTNNNGDKAWDELYPEEFGYAETSGTGGDTTSEWDQFIIKWFPCSRSGWPGIAVNGGTLPPNNEAQDCTFVLPKSYTPYE